MFNFSLYWDNENFCETKRCGSEGSLISPGMKIVAKLSGRPLSKATQSPVIFMAASLGIVGHLSQLFEARLS